MVDIRAKGFDLGKEVVRAPNAEVAGKEVGASAFAILDASAGVVKISQGEGTEVASVEVSAFLKEYKLPPKAPEASMPGWPIDYMCMKLYEVHLMKLRIMSALHIASAAVPNAFEQVTLVEKPKRCVRASAALDAFSLVLVPNTMKVNAREDKEKCWEGELFVDMQNDDVSTMLRGMKFSLAPYFSKEFPCPAWAVRTTEQESDANMEWTTMKVSDVAVAELPLQCKKVIAKASAESSAAAKASPKPAAKASAQSLLRQPVGKEYCLTVPVMVNKRPVKGGDELVVHRCLKRKPDAEPVPIGLSKLMKGSN